MNFDQTNKSKFPCHLFIVSNKTQLPIIWSKAKSLVSSIHPRNGRSHRELHCWFSQCSWIVPIFSMTTDTNNEIVKWMTHPHTKPQSESSWKHLSLITLYITKYFITFMSCITLMEPIMFVQISPFKGPTIPTRKITISFITHFFQPNLKRVWLIKKTPLLFIQQLQIKGIKTTNTYSTLHFRVQSDLPFTRLILCLSI